MNARLRRGRERPIEGPIQQTLVANTNATREVEILAELVRDAERGAGRERAFERAPFFAAERAGTCAQQEVERIEL
jgi:hypothetical protein